MAEPTHRRIHPKGYERQNNTASKCEFETTKTFKRILLQAIATIVTNIMNEQGVEYGVGLLQLLIMPNMRRQLDKHKLQPLITSIIQFQQDTFGSTEP
jgi:hypothetical protein